MILSIVFAGCQGGGLTEEQLRDPSSCGECHPDHLREWSGSMHAYASVDPVFRAMNARGQRDTDGALGDFCVSCHAPAAVALGLTTDGLNLDDLDPNVAGVNCWFCHQVTDVAGDHNNPLVLAFDDVFRGPIRDPVSTKAHGAEYSVRHDRDDLRSADLCGSCHDIVSPLGARIERTFEEWQESLFSKPGFGLTCGGCHMPGRDGIAAEADGVPLRRVHSHSMPGVDVALVDFPERDAQRALVQELLDDTVSAFLCVGPAGDPTLAVGTLENLGAGHMFPSGATMHRRVWVELVAYRDGQEIYRSDLTSGDPNLWSIRSEMTGTDGQYVFYPWQAAGIEGELLPVQTTTDPNDPDYVFTHVSHNWLVNGAPDRVTMAVKVMPMSAEMLGDLSASGDLDPTIATAMPTFTLTPTVLEWTPEVPVNAGELSCVPSVPPVNPAGTL